MLDEGVDEVAGAFAVDDAQEGMFGAEGIPEGKHGVIVEALGVVVLHVAAEVFAIGVGIEVGVDHAMIQSGVELNHVVFRASRHFDLAEFEVPDFFGVVAHGVEIPRLDVGIEVEACFVDRGGAEADLDEHFFLSFEGEKGFYAFAAGIVFSGFDDVAEGVDLAQTIFGEGFGELYVEIHHLVVGPCPGAAHASDVGVGDEFNIGIDDDVAVLQVEDDIVLRSSRIGIFMEACTFGGGEFYIDVVLVEFNGVVARGCFFIFV